MKLVFLSHTAPSGVFRVGSHHLARELAAVGHSVAHIATPVSLAHFAKAMRSGDTRARLRFARHPRRDADGVWQFVPVVPAPLGSIPTAVNELQLIATAGGRRRRLREFRSADVVFLDQPLLGSIVNDFPGATIVYRPTDAHHDPIVRTAEIRLLARAHAISAASASTLEQVTDGTEWSGPSTVIENGVDYEHFAPTSARVERSGVVYLGALDARFDWELLAALARALPHVPFTIAGPRPAAPPSLPANVSLIGAVTYEQAPRLLERHAVGILPLSSHPGNAGRSPMKYYEYLAAGLSVVALASDELRRRDDINVHLYTDAFSAVHAVTAALSAGHDERNAGQRAAEGMRWSDRAQRLLAFATSSPVKDAHDRGH